MKKGIFIVGCFMVMGVQLFGLDVMTYNIWNGFDFGKSDLRRELFVEFMNEEDCDVAALQELNRFNSFKLKRLAKAYGHPYAVILKITGYPVGLTSKKPIKVVKKQLNGFWHGFLHAQTQGIDFLVVHLSPASSEFRQKEMKALVAYIDENQLQREKLIVLGDFNAHAGADSVVLEGWPRVTQHASKENLQDGRIDYTVLGGFETVGLVEIVSKVNPDLVNQWTFPTPALVSQEECIARGERIDHQLASPKMAEIALEAEIIMNELTNQISDHYPVLVRYQDTE